MGRHKKLPVGPFPSGQRTIGTFFNLSGSSAPRTHQSPPVSPIRPIEKEPGSKRSLRYSSQARDYAVKEYAEAVRAAQEKGKTSLRGVNTMVVEKLKKHHPMYYDTHFSYKTLEHWLSPRERLGKRGRKAVLSPETVSALENRAKDLVARGAGIVNSATFMPHFIEILDNAGELDKIKESESGRSRYINRMMTRLNLVMRKGTRNARDKKRRKPNCESNPLHRDEDARGGSTPVDSSSSPSDQHELTQQDRTPR